MKRNWYLSALALLLCPLLFVSCSAPAEPATVTPTAASASGEQTAQPVALTTPASQPAAPSQPAEVTEPVKAEKQPEAEKAASSKTASSKAPAKPAGTTTQKAQAEKADKPTAATTKPATAKAQTASASSAAADSSIPGFYVCPQGPDYANFQNEADFRQWLINGTDHEEARQAVLAAMQTGQTVRYYAPHKAMNAKQMQLVKIETVQGSVKYTFSYNSAATGEKIGSVTINQLRDSEQFFLNEYKNGILAAQNGEEFYDIRELAGIRYVVEYVEDTQNVGFLYQKDGKMFWAFAEGAMASEVENLLPLLEVEPVTLRTDVVTE